MSFSFVGKLSSSKSLYNRALIAQSYESELQVLGESKCDDVLHMKKALFSLMNGLDIDCGAAGTVLRFMALRAARIPGEHILTGTERLFTRLPKKLLTLLRQLGAEVELENNKMKIISRGWKVQGDGLYVDSSESSQFASSVILNSWQLDKPLHLNFGRNVASRGYLNMTFEFMRSLGFIWKDSEEGVYIPSCQEIKAPVTEVEIDMSSAFCIASLGALLGSARIQNFPVNSLQPDRVFPELLGRMGVKVDFDKSCLKVSRSDNLKALTQNLTNTPDLFPVLAVLCSFAEGESHLFGASHLKHKESDRLKKTAELLGFIGAEYTLLDDGIKIMGKKIDLNQDGFEYDTDEDHRLAMAAGILKKIGYPVEIKGKSCVNKSFPEFWDIIGE